MAINLETDLGSGTGLLYITTTSGAAGSSTGIVTNLTNDTQGLLALMHHANTNDKLVDTDAISDIAQQYRFKYWVYNNAGAVEGTVHASATEITRFVTNFRTVGRNTANITVADNVLKFERTGPITTVLIPTITESVSYMQDVLSTDATDDVSQEGDIVILRLANDNTGTVTVTPTVLVNRSYTSANAIFLKTQRSFKLNSLSDVLAFQKHNGGWRELFRSNARERIFKDLRDDGIPVSEGGVKDIEMTTGGTLDDLVSGTDSGVINITGTKTLASAFNLPLSTAASNGDVFEIWYRANTTTNVAGGNKVTIGGVDLTDEEALNGLTKPILLRAYYLGATAAWKVTKLLNSDETERALGNPTADGQVLASTTAGVRSWVDAPNGVKIATATYDFAISGGAQNTTFTVGKELIPAGAIILLDQCIIEMETLLASGGAAQVAVGYSGGAADVDAIHDEQAFDAAPFNSNTAVTRTSPADSGTVIKVSATAKTSITVTTSNSQALTAGKFHIHVPYIA